MFCWFFKRIVVLKFVPTHFRSIFGPARWRHFWGRPWSFRGYRKPLFGSLGCKSHQIGRSWCQSSGNWGQKSQISCQFKRFLIGSVKHQNLWWMICFDQEVCQTVLPDSLKITIYGVKNPQNMLAFLSWIV